MKRKPVPQTEEEKLYDVSYPILLAPWHGHLTPIRVRRLSLTQALSCGDFSMIELFEDKIAKNERPTIEMMNAYAERHQKLCKLAMVKPTYDEAMKIAGAHVDSAGIDRELAEIKSIIQAIDVKILADKELAKNRELAKERRELAEKFNALELAYKFLLPPDFSAFVVNYCLQIDTSDIKSVTEEMLLNAAILASRGHDNPSDHLSGVFTDLMKREIDNRAWVLFDAEKDDRKRKKKAG